MLSFHYLISTWCCLLSWKDEKFFFSCLMLCNKISETLLLYGAMNCVYWTHPFLFVNNLWCRKYSVQYYFYFLTPWNDPSRTIILSFVVISLLFNSLESYFAGIINIDTHTVFSECEKKDPSTFIIICLLVLSFDFFFRGPRGEDSFISIFAMKVRIIFD